MTLAVKMFDSKVGSTECNGHQACESTPKIRSVSAYAMNCFTVARLYMVTENSGGLDGEA